MPSVKRGKTQTIGKLILQPEAWSWVERAAMSAWGTRQIATILIGQFPKIRKLSRYDENPDRAQESLGRLIRYHMQDSLRIDLSKYGEFSLEEEEYVGEIMSRFGFAWKVENQKMARVPVNTWRIYSLTRRRLQARLRHPFYSPFYSKRYDEYRPVRDDGGAEAPPLSGFYYRDSAAPEMYVRGKVDTHVGFDQVSPALG